MNTTPSYPAKDLFESVCAMLYDLITPDNVGVTDIWGHITAFAPFASVLVDLAIEFPKQHENDDREEIMITVDELAESVDREFVDRLFEYHTKFETAPNTIFSYKQLLLIRKIKRATISGLLETSFANLAERFTRNKRIILELESGNDPHEVLKNLRHSDPLARIVLAKAMGII
jgi:hypothetical protein